MGHAVEKASLGISAFAAALGFAAAATAQEFGEAGRFAIGAERITGFSTTDTEGEIEATPANLDVDGNVTSFHLLGANAATPFASPRVGFDYFVIDGLSIGGNLIYISTDTEFQIENLPDADEKTTVFAFGPRVGYAYMFSDIVGIWPRGGFTYLNVNTEDEGNNETKYSLFALSAEVPLVIAPVPHAAFIVGPTVDFTVSGSGEYDPDVGPDTDIDDISINTFGIQAGIVAWF